MIIVTAYLSGNLEENSPRKCEFSGFHGTCCSNYGFCVRTSCEIVSLSRRFGKTRYFLPSEKISVSHEPNLIKIIGFRHG
jgi:hypothetical protein